MNVRFLLAVLLCAFACNPGPTAAAEDFYKGKTITINVDGAGSYEVYARQLGKYMPKYIPGEPAFVVKQILGAAGLKAANYMYNQAPKDGTEIAGVHGQIPTAPIFTTSGIQYDPTKFGWIGSVTKEIFLGYFWHTSPVQTMEGAREKEVVAGGQALGSMSIDIPVLANAMMGTKFKIINGYSGANENRLALERGEISAVFGTSWSSLMTGQPDWLKDKKINVFVQFGERPHPQLPSVPSLYNYVLNPDDKRALEIFLARQETGKPYFAPPGVPADRLAILRQAFDKAVRDPGFLAEAEKLNLEVVDPLGGREMEEFIARMAQTPPRYAERINEVFTKFGDGK